MNIRITIEYDGEPFVGWQIQTNGSSIQESIEKAIKRVTGEYSFVRGAGRTDAGVHARAQVANFHVVSGHDSRAVEKGAQRDFAADHSHFAG